MTKPPGHLGGFFLGREAAAPFFFGAGALGMPSNIEAIGTSNTWQIS